MTSAVITQAGRIMPTLTRREVKAMLQHHGLAVVVAVTWLVTLFVAAIVFLAYHGLGTEALTAAVIAPIVGLLVSVSSRLGRIERQVSPQSEGGSDANR
jgi:hypothetical protein